jgi:hypothetical protein
VKTQVPAEILLTRIPIHRDSGLLQALGQPLGNIIAKIIRIDVIQLALDGEPVTAECHEGPEFHASVSKTFSPDTLISEIEFWPTTNSQ